METDGKGEKKWNNIYHLIQKPYGVSWVQTVNLHCLRSCHTAFQKKLTKQVKPDKTIVAHYVYTESNFSQ
jgi:hypothetical protein